MPRNPFRFVPDTYYHLSARANNRDWFSLPKADVWRIMCAYLHFAHHAFGARILAFVLMDNHYHLIARFPEATLSETMQYFQRETSRSLAFESGRINHVYGTRVFRSMIGTDHYLRNAYKYVYRNPVEACLAKTVESYPYSSLPGLLGKIHLPFPVEQDFILFGAQVESTLKWLNEPPSESAREAMKFGLRHQHFRLPKVQSSRRIHELEHQLY